MLGGTQLDVIHDRERRVDMIHILIHVEEELHHNRLFGLDLRQVLNQDFPRGERVFDAFHEAEDAGAVCLVVGLQVRIRNLTQPELGPLAQLHGLAILLPELDHNSEIPGNFAVRERNGQV